MIDAPFDPTPLHRSIIDRIDFDIDETSNTQNNTLSSPPYRHDNQNEEINPNLI